MPTIIVVDREGKEHSIEASSGVSVMEVLRANGFDELIALCGGSCSCATCHVYINVDEIGCTKSISEDEDFLLSGSEHRKKSSRLSCQISITEDLDGIRVEIAPED